MVLVLMAVIVFLMCLVWINQRESRDRELDYISAIMAKSLPEFAMTRKRLAEKTKDRIKEIYAENKLAMDNERMLRDEEGVPIT